MNFLITLHRPQNCPCYQKRVNNRDCSQIETRQNKNHKVAELIFQYRHNKISHRSGISSVSRDQDDITKLFQHIDPSPNISNLANTINEAFVCPMNDFSPLSTDFPLAQDAPISPPFVVSTYSVYKKLSSLKPTKAQGPDGVPAW